MKILFSANACAPGRGSEPGIGWHWPLEAARMGHEVWGTILLGFLLEILLLPKSQKAEVDSDS